MSLRIIAEAGVNHDGSLEKALALVDAAAASGATQVKFQSFKAAKIVSDRAPKASYQTARTDAGESQLAMLRRLELSEDAHRVLIARCAEKGIGFLSTPFDLESLDLLTGRFGLEEIKIGSGELTNAPLLYALGQAQVRVILSTGMATLAEIETALGVLGAGMTGRAPGRQAFAEALRDSAVWQALRGVHPSPKRSRRA